MIEKAGLSLRQQRLSNIDTGHPFLDSALRFAIRPRRDTNIKLTKVTSFDGLSLSAFDPDAHFRDAMTITKGGAVRRGGDSGLSAIAEESLDAISDMEGLPVRQLARIGHVLLHMTGIVQHDGETTQASPLTLYGRKIGAANYRVRKYHALKERPESARDALDAESARQLVGKPALITRASIDIDLSDAPVQKEDGLVRLRVRENYDVGQLLPSHRRNVRIDGWHDAVVTSTDPETGVVDVETHNGHDVLDLGPVEYKVITTSRRASRS